VAIKLDSNEMGAEVYQVTEGNEKVTNIYPEFTFCSADGRFFVFLRYDDKDELNPAECVICEFETWKMRVAARSCGSVAVTRDGFFYSLKYLENGDAEIISFDIGTGEITKVKRLYKDKGFIKARSYGTVSPDHKYYACGVVVDPKYREFGVELIDLETGECSIIDTGPDICNTHVQFEPSEGKKILVQHNRGAQIDENGKTIRLVGDEGGTLYLLDIYSGKRTPLLAGHPYTSHITGHEAWIGNTKQILFSVHAAGDYAPEKGNLLAVAEGKPAWVIAKDHSYMHVSASLCGNYFCCDEPETGDIILGNVKTGKNIVLCHSKSSFRRPQNTHAHPYLSPDLKWVIFNSDRSGIPQIHVARVPDEIIQELNR
jgi:WD40 repeat protein